MRRGVQQLQVHAARTRFRVESLPSAWQPLDLPQVEQGFGERFGRWTAIEPRPRAFSELFGTNASLALRTELHHELCGRLAWGMEEIRSLPYGLDAMPGVKTTLDIYQRSLDRLESCLGPEGLVQDGPRTLSALEESYDAHGTVVPLVMTDVRKLVLQRGCEQQREVIDAHLERFCANRIAARFPMLQLLEAARDGTSRCGRCDASALARAAAKQSMGTCRNVTGRSPQILVDGAAKLHYWPAALSYVLQELMKNSCKAVAERAAFGALPPVICTVQNDSHHVKITITDKGVGVAKEQMKRIWGFAASGKTRGCSGDALSGFGVGLPLSRSYVHYFGGDISLTSVEGEGTTVQLTLEKGSERSEVLSPPFSLRD